MKRLEKLTLRQLLLESRRSYGTLPAMSLYNGPTMSYEEFYNRSVAVSTFLRDKGISRGDKVAILSGNHPNWPLVYFAIASIGAISVPILPDFHAEEAKTILKHSESKAVFVSWRLFDKIRGSGLPPFLLEDLIEVDGDVEKVLLEDTDKRKNCGKPIDLEKKDQQWYDSLDVEKEDTACILYTSGTTGKSKGVVLSHENIVFDAIAASDIPVIKPGYKVLSILPLSHTYECTIGMLVPFLMGAHFYYLEKPPAPAVLLPALKSVKPNIMLAVPLLIEKIYRNSVLPGLQKSFLTRNLYKLSPFRKLLNRVAGKKLMKVFGGNLSFFGIGGAPLAPDVEMFLREARFPYAIGYGLTETSPLIAGGGPFEVQYRSTGKVVSGVAVRIADPKPESGEGEIQVKGPIVMKGYYKEPEMTKAVFTEDGWFRTGDLGVMDEDGVLYIRGRLKNMILGPSGENIYPEAIESVINEFEFVTESIVFEEEGKIVALVHFDYDAIKSQIKDLAESAGHFSQHVGDYVTELRKKVNARLNAFSRVSRIEPHEEPFEKTPTKKIKRYLYTKMKGAERTDDTRGENRE